MRPLLVITLAVGILGGVGAYVSFTQHMLRGQAPPSQSNLQAAPGEYRLTVTLSFDAAADAFAIDSAAILIRFADRQILRVDDSYSAGQSLQSDVVDNIVVGRNEFYIEAYPSESQNTRPQAARVQVLRDGRVVGEQTLWSDPGEPIRGPVLLDVLGESAAERRDH